MLKNRAGSIQRRAKVILQQYVQAPIQTRNISNTIWAETGYY